MEMNREHAVFCFPFTLHFAALYLQVKNWRSCCINSAHDFSYFVEKMGEGGGSRDKAYEHIFFWKWVPVPPGEIWR